jgi:hypothetical protein
VLPTLAAGHLPPRTLIVCAGRTEHTDRSFGDTLGRSIADAWKRGNTSETPLSGGASHPSSGGGGGGGGRPGLSKQSSFGVDHSGLHSEDLRHLGSQASTPTGGALLTAADIGGAARSLSLNSAGSPKGGPTSPKAAPSSPHKSSTLPQGLIDEFLEHVKYVRVAAIPTRGGGGGAAGVGLYKLPHSLKAPGFIP